MKRSSQRGFSLIELLVAATVFSFLIISVSQLFVTALDIQRRAAGIQSVEENTRFVIETIAREIRVSDVTSGDTNCAPPDPFTTRSLTIEHPVNGTVTYVYDRTGDAGAILRNGETITTSDVDFASFAFCVSGSGGDDQQTRVTMPMTVESVAGRPENRSQVSLQTTVVSRSLVTDLTN